MDLITMALPKGRMMDEIVDLLKAAGFDCDMLLEESRKLIFDSEKDRTRYITMRPSDVPTYVEYGAADLGITGKDVLLENKKDVYELMDLGIAYCRFVLAAPRKSQVSDYRALPGLRIATKFPVVAEEFFQRQGVNAEIIKLSGATELAPSVGLAEMVVDIVSTGRTLAENNLVIVEEICDSTARLIANQVSFRLKSGRIKEITGSLQAAVEKGGK